MATFRPKSLSFDKDGNIYKLRGLTQTEENQIAAAGTDLTGATASTNGVHGLVPAPVAGDQGKVLMGSGNWDYASAAVYSFELDEVSNVSGAYTHTTSLAGVTSDMTPIRLELEDAGVFRDKIDVECGNGSITLSCNNVVGTSDVTVYVLKQVHSNWEVLTSDEYDELAGMIGDLDDDKQDKTDNSLGTTAKTVVGAVNELYDNIGTLSNLTTTAKNNAVAAINELHTRTQTKRYYAAYTVNSTNVSWSWSTGYIQLVGDLFVLSTGISPRAASSDWMNLLTVQSDYKPTYEVRCCATAEDGSETRIVRITTEGNIDIYKPSAKSYWFEITWLKSINN